MARLSLRDVVKIYAGGVKAVDGFSLETGDGEFIVLVGPSGCGKSTILRAIAGLEEITSGDISLDGRSIVHAQPKDRDLAMVFQSYALYPHMTVYENLAFSLKMRHMAKDEIDRRVRSTATMLGLAALLERKPKALSGGQRQRVAVGRAIVRDPKCFLFDEPLSNVDAKVRAEMRAEIKELQIRLRTTSVYVTHDQEEAMTLGDRVVVMRDGVVQQIGPPLDVYRHPSNKFVAAFLGTPQMNFFTGRLVSEGGQLWFQHTAARIAVPARAIEKLRGRRDDVVLGIRPQSIRLEPSGAAGRFASLRVSTDWIEPLGDRMDLHLSLNETTKMRARVDATRTMRREDIRQVFVDTEALYFFANDDGGSNLALGS